MSTLAVILFGVVSSTLIKVRANSTVIDASGGSYACIADTELCPDGTSVGRVPPYCQFAPCLGEERN